MLRYIYSLLIFASCTGDPTQTTVHTDDYTSYFDSINGVNTGVEEQVIDLSGIEQDEVVYEDGVIVLRPGSATVGSMLPSTYTLDLHLEVRNDSVYDYTIKTKGGHGTLERPTYTHIVQKGETISTIAQKYGVQQSRVNGGNSKINIGQTIKID
jgi:hypothetical protein